MKEKYIEDLRDIKDIMNRSSRFISLSGLSGIAAGIIALGGAYLAYRSVYTDQEFMSYRTVDITPEMLSQLLMIAVGTLLLALGAGIYFTTRKTRKLNQKVWDLQTKRLVINLAIPLVAGGIFCLLMLYNGYIGLIAPLTLIFYGLALVNASKYTLNEIRSLGIIEVCLGLLATQFIGYGLLLWALGFGILHIVYGTIMYFKYQS